MAFVGARILKIALRTGTSTRMDVSLPDQRAFLGAASLGAHLLYPGLRPEADPLDDEAPIALLTGPIIGKAGLASGRAVFCSRPPASGL
jgi:aldehyde:ferredoxin oxidoreductase